MNMRCLNMTVNERNYSEEELLEKAIELVRKGMSFEEVQNKLNLSDDDIELMDFVLSEF